MSGKHKTNVYTSTDGGKKVKMGWVSHDHLEDFLDGLTAMVESIKEDLKEDDSHE